MTFSGNEAVDFFSRRLFVAIFDAQIDALEKCENCNSNGNKETGCWLSPSKRTPVSQSVPMEQQIVNWKTLQSSPWKSNRLISNPALTEQFSISTKQNELHNSKPHKIQMKCQQLFLTRKCPNRIWCWRHPANPLSLLGKNMQNITLSSCLTSQGLLCPHMHWSHHLNSCFWLCSPPLNNVDDYFFCSEPR